MIKKVDLGFKGMSKDLAKDKQSDKYFDAKNIRILATDQKSSFSVTNEKGNELVFDIPLPVFNESSTQIEYTVNGELKTLPYESTGDSELEENYSGETSGQQIIIGTTDLRDGAIIITTDDKGWDCFWEVTGINTDEIGLDLLYMNNLQLSSSNLVQIVFNYENSVIQKIYFVDGNNQLRFMNIRQSIENGDSKNLIDVKSTSIDTVSEFDLSQPKVDYNSVISGGNHTSGMIQYSYSLYVLNGSQTTLSPFSELVSIDKGPGNGGGEVNEQLGRSVIVSVDNIDNDFTHIILYSIKYTSYNQNPEISIVTDKEIDNFQNFIFYDDGTSTNTVSLEEFIFLGSDPIVPQHIATKDNILFPVNIKEKTFEVDIDYRIYGHNNLGTATVWENLYINNNNVLTGSQTVLDSSYTLPSNHDAINKNYEIYKYQSDGSTLGAEGLYFKLEVVQNSSMTEEEASEYKYLKDRELYRFGIVLYNRRGQTTDPKWLCDIKAPEGNLEGNYNQIKFELKPEFTNYVNNINTGNPDDIPVGYKLLRADRKISDQTILTQGMINPMIANYAWRNKRTNYQDRVDLVDDNLAIKMPSVTRMFDTMYPFVGCKDYHELAFQEMNSTSLSRNNKIEGFKSADSQDWRAQSFQHNRLMQMFSPEVLFTDVQVDASYKLKIVGLSTQSEVYNWSKENNPSTQVAELEVLFTNGITQGTISNTGTLSSEILNGSFGAGEIADQSFWGPTNGNNTRAEHQCHRVFKGDYYPNGSILSEYEIYGSPEITEAGADFKSYNNDGKLRYCNNLKNMLLDDWNESDDANNNGKVQIVGINTIGARCITFVEGPDDDSYDIQDRASIEEMWSNTGIPEANGVLLAEFVKDYTAVYLGNVYGGFTSEAKSISSYIEIGDYADISTTEINILSPGDTFCQDFTFAKMSRADEDEITNRFQQVAETVTIKVETQIDLKNRNDLSITEWDNQFQPKYDEYTKYNRVYSQNPTIITNISTGSKIKKVREFDTRIMASKTKIPGEFIDSWTDFLINESMDLDGKYGPINGVVNFNDEIYTLQDTGVARIAINPRVQVQGSDGVAVELGTGGILYDYQYFSTKSGTLNKWSIVTTQSAFYYVDLLNKAIMQFNGKVTGLTDQQGFHYEFNNRLIHEDIIVNNPVKGLGASTGYNSVNNDVYFTFLQSNDSFTIAFNEATGTFTSYYSYTPAWYINRGTKMITTDATNTQLWEHFKNDPGNFYGQVEKSNINFLISPSGKGDCTYNTAEYRMEMKDSNGNDLPLVTLDSVQVYNEYQDSGDKPLIIRNNLFKKERNWNIKLPRQEETRARIKSPWAFMKLTLNNSNGDEMVLHDITVTYTEY